MKRSAILKRKVVQGLQDRTYRMSRASNLAHDRSVVQRRIAICAFVVLTLALVLLGRLAYVQISSYQQFDLQAKRNRISELPITPPRGKIYDRSGQILAENTSTQILLVRPEDVADMDKLLGELGQLIVINEVELNRFKSQLKRRPSYEWQTLKTNLSTQEAAVIALNQHRYRGIELRGRLQRHYPLGQLTSHVVGYVGRIDADDFKHLDREAYRGIEYVGRSGLEKYYESAMFGKSGVDLLETNAHGRKLLKLGQIPPQAGKAVHLSLDIELQRKSYELLGNNLGSVVAMEPATGQILAFASAPYFDPNLFVNGISAYDYAQLRDAETRPLFNRAADGVYAPGSTIKSFMLLAGMQNGINPDEKRVCAGAYKLPYSRRRFRDWKEDGHGPVDAHQALEQSCDIYFYDLAHKLGIEKIHEGLSFFGFGKKTGVDFPNESRGLVPSSQHKLKTKGEPWYPGETVITGIGQGELLVTPLQLATNVAVLANRGRRVIPRFLSRYEPEINSVDVKSTGRYDLKDNSNYDLVINAMRDVVHGEHGTARGIGYTLKEYDIAGKTGTAQVVALPANRADYDEEKVARKLRDHSLFIGFAPVEDPKIAIAVVAENAGSGSKTAAPIARKLMDYYLLERGGLSQNASLATQ